jgi:preprotein translocase subunit SecG
MTAFLFGMIALYVFVCVILILLVLIQKGRGGGLASAFGGGGGNTAFGSKTGDVLTWGTSVVFGVFLVIAISLSVIADRVNRNAAPPSATGTSIPAPGAPANPPQP